MVLTACNFGGEPHLPHYQYCEKLESMGRYAMALRMDRVSRHNAPNFFDDIRHPQRAKAVHPMIIYQIIDRAYSFPIEIGATYADKERNKERYAADVNARCMIGQLGRSE